MPAHSAPTRGTTPVSTSVVLDCHHGADLADLLGCLREWIDAEHDQLDPQLAKHDYDLNGLRIALDHYTALLRGSPDQRRF